MRIAINCRSFLTKRYAGIGRYAFNLVQMLTEIDQENEYWLYVQKKYFDFKRKAPKIAADNFHVKVDWLGRGIARTLKSVDIYHSPSPDYISMDHAKIIVTVHDLVYRTYPEGHTPETCETTDRQLRDIVQRAHKIICCSQNTINDLQKFFDVEDDKIRLIYQGVNKNIFFRINEKDSKRANQMIRKKGVTKPYILFVGTIEPRKNLKNLLEAFSQLKNKKRMDIQLVVIGMKGWMVDDLEKQVKRLEIENHVIFPGYVSDEELRCFYNLAQVFVYPSFYEGFGFPIVEAFSCGAAVVTSNVSSCPEIAADGAITIDPHKPEEIADAVEKIMKDKTLRETLQENALKRSRMFSFRNTAEQTLEVYQEVDQLS